MRTRVAALLVGAALAATPAFAVDVPGGRFRTVLPPAQGVKEVTVAPFSLDRTPVTNAEFARFVRAQPQWRRDRVARIFADQGYLGHWASADAPGAALARRPVVQVSWFAASAYCESKGARLPTWHEWEYAAAASDTRRDGRDDPAWKQRILAWYSRPATDPLPEAGSTPANAYGIQDLHGMVWEWVEDVAAMMISGDNREQGDPDMMKFCGSGALTMEEKDNYATLMRIAMLSSMQANYTSATMGFRCAGGRK
ncbi:MAG: Hercynine oxygenase [Steroidobacteraceae bacterium]|nr:Hercynine oxygenase [Steroidobacteraceae bacterium]